MRNEAFERLVYEYLEDGVDPRRSYWVDASKRFFGSHNAPALLNELEGEWHIALHGSAARGIDDKVSDLDFWLLVDEVAMEQFDVISSSRFVEIDVEGKPGHINPILLSEIDEAFSLLKFELINELRCAVPLYDPRGSFEKRKQRAQLAVSDAVIRAAFFQCYVEMRACHKSADNPMDRHDSWASLSGVVKTIEYAMKCALILDGRPWPYGKWLHVETRKSPTGQRIIPNVERVLDLLAEGRQSLLGPEKENAISAELRSIRRTLVDQAKRTGIDEPWLDRWWIYIDEARAALGDLAWPA